MRDIALSIVLFACVPVALARPFVGAVVFAWLSLMNPHRLTWGFAYDIPWAQMVAIATLIGLVFATERQVFDSVRRMRLLIAYLAWTAITTMFALSETAALPKLIEFAKIQLMCLVTLALLSNWRRVEVLTIVATLSVAFFGIKGGVFTVLTGGAFRVWGPPGSVIADNNQLAAALVMTMPLLFWLRQRTRNPWYRWAFLGCIALSGISILGSHSRGAFVAVVAMGLFLVLRSTAKFEALIAVFVGAGLAIVLMPAEYWARIASIGAYEQDASTMGRFEMWKTALNVANARITGGGFDMYVGSAVGEYAAGQMRSSHSIYFQALGEHGWPGLVLFLSLRPVGVVHCRPPDPPSSCRRRKRQRGVPDADEPGRTGRLRGRRRVREHRVLGLPVLPGGDRVRLRAAQGARTRQATGRACGPPRVTGHRSLPIDSNLARR